MTTTTAALLAEARKLDAETPDTAEEQNELCRRIWVLLPQLADALEAMRAEFAATLRVVRQGLDSADPTYKIATEAIDRLETPARPMEPGT